jgi:hypothetical protein
MHLCVTGQIADAAAHTSGIELDLSITPGVLLSGYCEAFRDAALHRVAAASTCSKMRPDGFGGIAIPMARDAILGKSTADILEDVLTKAGLGGDALQTTDRIRGRQFRVRVRVGPGRG